jgi:Sulfotransferase family
MNPYVFILGCPRSGTTLLQRLLDAHPQLAVIDETLWIPRYLKRRRYVTEHGLTLPGLLAELRHDRRFARMKLEPSALARLEGELPLRYADFVTKVFDLYGEAAGKPLVGDKSPGYVRSMGILHALWPAARFIHLIRDGRDVALSALAWRKADRLFESYPTWPGDPVTTAALWWERNVRLGREAAARVPADVYHELRYEGVVGDPERACVELCAFLGLEYDDTMLRFHEGRANPSPGIPSKRQWLPPTPGLRDWRTQLAEPELERFEAVAGGLLDELGYERGAPDPRPGRLAAARAARRQVSERVRSRGRPLPGAWAA